MLVTLADIVQPATKGGDAPSSSQQNPVDDAPAGSAAGALLREWWEYRGVWPTIMAGNDWRRRVEAFFVADHDPLASKDHGEARAALKAERDGEAV